MCIRDRREPERRGNGAGNERVHVELVFVVLALLHHGHDVGVQVRKPLVLGAHQVERAAHLELRAGGAVLAVGVDLRRLLGGHQHRYRCRGVLLVGGERDPPVAVVQALADAVPDGLAHHLHGLVVVVRVGIAERRNGRVVDERAVGALLGVHQIIVVVSERRTWHKRRRQRRSQHERGKGPAQPSEGPNREAARPHHSTSPVRIWGARRREMCIRDSCSV